MKKIKMVISDLDGTLLNREGEIEQIILVSLFRLNQNGIIFSIATGRGKHHSQNIIKNLGVAGPCIINNGANIMDVKNTVFLNETIDPLTIKEHLLHLIGIGTSVLFETLDEFYFHTCTDWIKAQAETASRLTKISKIEDLPLVNKIYIHAKNSDISQEVDDFNNSFGLQARAVMGERFYEITPRFADKSAALRKLASMYAISMENILCIGDGYNDVEMIRDAGVGVAVKNAVGPVKEVADFITTKESYEGVLEAFEKYSLF